MEEIYVASLGAAGCRNSDGSFCSFFDLEQCRCSKYRTELQKHWSGEPYRADECGDDAMMNRSKK